MLALTSEEKLKYRTYSVAGPLSPVHAEHTCTEISNSSDSSGITLASGLVLAQCKGHVVWLVSVSGKMS